MYISKRAKKVKTSFHVNIFPCVSESSLAGSRVCSFPHRFTGLRIFPHIGLLGLELNSSNTVRICHWLHLLKLREQWNAWTGQTLQKSKKNINMLYALAGYNRNKINVLNYCL